MRITIGLKFCTKTNNITEKKVEQGAKRWARHKKWSILVHYCGESLTNIFSSGVSLFYWYRSYTEHELLKVVERENLIISPLPLVWAGLLFLFCKTGNTLSYEFVRSTIQKQTPVDEARAAKPTVHHSSLIDISLYYICLKNCLLFFS